MGDVPVGVFLSGGLDSSLVAAIAARWYGERGGRLKTFAVGLEDSPDLLAARAVAEYLDTEHHESVYTAEDALMVLPKVVRTIESFDPSLVRSAVPNYILAEFAARHVKVVLTGEGADEIFAGYEYLEDFRTEEGVAHGVGQDHRGSARPQSPRADRVTMAHGLEARVPFLELDMISLGLSLPAGWKLAGEGQEEKDSCARPSKAGCPTISSGARRRSSVTARAQLPSSKNTWRRASPKRSSNRNVTRSSRHCAPARRSPTTASSPKISEKSAPDAPSGASPQRSIMLPEP